MALLSLNDLPEPPVGRVGWPWTLVAGGGGLAEDLGDASGSSATGKALKPYPCHPEEWPRVSIITPSYNQGRYIEETIRSVLLQGYPNLEYIVLDGGSSDGTVKVLEKYSRFIAYWCSAKDGGQAEAINKGLDRATGDWVGWQNSDDFYEPGALRHLVEAAGYPAAGGAGRAAEPAGDVIYGRVKLIDEHSRVTGDYPTGGFDLMKMLPWANMFNQSMFFSRRVLDEGFRIDRSLRHYVDHDLFWRLILAGYKFKHVPEISACFRLHGEAKGSTQHEIAANELHELYMRLYREMRLPEEVRELALKSMRGNCLDQFGKSRWHLFRKFAADIARNAGWWKLGPGLIARRAVVMLGEGNIERVRRLKRV